MAIVSLRWKSVRLCMSNRIWTLGGGAVLYDWFGYETPRPWLEVHDWEASWLRTKSWSYYGASPRWEISEYFWTISIPLWVFFVIIGSPTFWLWHLDRRRPAPGTCKCGYDLTGNTSGRCPECGKTANRSMEPNR